MDNIRKVVFYGSHSAVSTVGVDLQGRVEFQVFQIESLLPDALQRGPVK